MTDRNDEPLKRDLTVEPRARRTKAERPERADMDRQDLTDDERLQLFRQNMHSNALPALPMIEGYRTIWLTTTNPRDSIQNRMRLGYELLKAEEVPGLENASDTTGQYPGVIAVNEMVAAKIREDLYQMYMRENHHDRPLQEEEKLRQAIDAMEAEANRDGGGLAKGDGISEMLDDRSPPRPEFT